MKNRILLFSSIVLTSIGFLGLNSILLSKSINDKYVFIKKIYLNNEDVYDDIIIDEYSFKVSSKVLINENVLSFELHNVSLNDVKVQFVCQSDNNIIEVLNPESYLIQAESAIKRSFIINYDSQMEDTLSCHLENI